MFAQITSWDHLLLAYQRAAVRKRGRAEVAAFEHRLEENLIALHHALVERSYRPGAYNSFFIHEPKRRLISAAPFPDRVVHHALCAVIESVFERGFVADSFANRVGKRTLRCPAYVRYVDDLLLFADDKASLWAWKGLIEARLGTLRLVIHPGAHPRPMTEGIPFLGFVIFPHRRRLKRRKGIAFQRRVRDLLLAHEHGLIDDALLLASIRGWAEHARHGNTTGLRKAVLADVPAKILAQLAPPAGVHRPSDAPLDRAHGEGRAAERIRLSLEALALLAGGDNDPQWAYGGFATLG